MERTGLHTERAKDVVGATGRLESGSEHDVDERVVKPGGDAEIKARWGHDVISVAIAEPLLTTAGSTATMTGVNSLSANPVAAVKFLELLNSDVKFYNTFARASRAFTGSGTTRQVS